LSQLHGWFKIFVGAALNLHLPALVDVSRKTELLGKQLEITPTHPELLKMRQSMIDHLEIEYDRLDQYMPEARQNAEVEQNDEGEEEDEEAEGEVENGEENYDVDGQQIDHMLHPDRDQIDSRQSNGIDSMPQSSEPSMRCSQSGYRNASAPSSQPVSQQSSRSQSYQQQSRNMSSLNYSIDHSAQISNLNSQHVSQNRSGEVSIH